MRFYAGKLYLTIRVNIISIDYYSYHYHMRTLDAAVTMTKNRLMELNNGIKRRTCSSRGPRRNSDHHYFFIGRRSLSESSRIKELPSIIIVILIIFSMYCIVITTTIFIIIKYGAQIVLL